MKHIKEFENLNNNELGINDYVICKETGSLNEFLSLNIGQVIQVDKYDRTLYVIEYKNVPEFLSYRFLCPIKDKFLRNMYKYEIKYWSKDREDLEAIIEAKKYNL